MARGAFTEFTVESAVLSWLEAGGWQIDTAGHHPERYAWLCRSRGGESVHTTPRLDIAH